MQNNMARWIPRLAFAVYFPRFLAGQSTLFKPTYMCMWEKRFYMWCFCFRCQCQLCSVMPTANECRCCMEIDEMRVFMDGVSEACITQHPGFAVVCLDRWVLQTAYWQYRQQYSEQINDENRWEIPLFILKDKAKLLMDTVTNILLNHSHKELTQDAYILFDILKCRHFSRYLLH